MASSSGQSWRDGMSSDNIKGLVLALSSSIFIGASFIVKKKGLKKAGASGVRAGVGGYSYLYEPLWWVGMITINYANSDKKIPNFTVIVGEIANFAAYAFAPAILVTPLGALSIIIRHEINAALAHIILREKLHIFGILGCVLCVVGSTTIVLHAPQEREIGSVIEVWELATEPAFLFYAALVMTIAFILIFHIIPEYGQTHIMVYIGVCSLVGSLSVMSVKALGIAMKLTLSGTNQLIYPQTWAFTLVVITCVLTQMNYLNKGMAFNDGWSLEQLMYHFSSFRRLTGALLDFPKELRGILEGVTQWSWIIHSSLRATTCCAVIVFSLLTQSIKALDTFNTAVVSPIYYVMFTSLTILASVIMFKDWDRQNPTQIVTEMCGFVTILSGTFLLHKTKDMGDGTCCTTSLSMRLPKHGDDDDLASEGIPLKRQESLRSPRSP
ncbi:hypothetical protein EZV62_019046 [Acer yangbiense]|uniref:Probable magnesium transporter n=1 Tax=Acer yangbiense TaxID=1000413 RepID=A0A5C7H9S7_9ROSI|nr:hypothetical protein EZV62_019046 [Acer yangbiense]